MKNNDKQTKETKTPSFEINSRRERVNFTSETENTKPYDIEKNDWQKIWAEK